jgi:hypothetical protein
MCYAVAAHHLSRDQVSVAHEWMRLSMAAAATVLYVQIPAYRDSELVPTLRSLYRNASHRQRIRVRVLWQHGPGESLPDDVMRLPGLEVEAMPAADSEGCNWARRRLQAAWRGEPYTAFLDSHHRFARGWDELAIGMLEALRASGIRRPLLTAYLPPYRPDHPAKRGRMPYKIYPLQRESGVLTRLTAFPIRHWRSLDRPVAADFLSLHFALADGRFNADVPMDPAIYFFGDEVLTGARAFTKGYRLFHPHRIIGWHAYDRAQRVTHWSDHSGTARRHRDSLTRLRRIYESSAVARYEAHIGLPLVLS